MLVLDHWVDGGPAVPCKDRRRSPGHGRPYARPSPCTEIAFLDVFLGCQAPATEVIESDEQAGDVVPKSIAPNAGKCGSLTREDRITEIEHDRRQHRHKEGRSFLDRRLGQHVAALP